MAISGMRRLLVRSEWGRRAGAVQTLLAGLFAAAVFGVQAGAGGRNLVRNGNFEQGRNGQPTDWSPVDNLTTFWDSGGHPGRCIRFDTAVQQVDKRALQKAMAAARKAGRGMPRHRSRSRGNQYSTVGAHEGVWLWSRPIRIRPDDRYFIIEADVLGPARSSWFMYPQVFLRGYRKFDPGRDAGTSSYFQTPFPGGPAYSELFGKKQRRAHSGDYLMVWRGSLVCRIEKKGVWKHYVMGFKFPKMKRYHPEVLLLKVYAMWPLGNYKFDNIVLRRATRSEYLTAKKHRHSSKGFEPRP